MPLVTTMVAVFPLAPPLITYPNKYSGNPAHISSYDRFTELFHHIFHHVPEGKELGKQLLSVTQGNCSTAEYTLDFRTLAAGSGLNETALKTAYHQGLDPGLSQPSNVNDKKKSGLCFYCGSDQQEVSKCPTSSINTEGVGSHQSMTTYGESLRRCFYPSVWLTLVQLEMSLNTHRRKSQALSSTSPETEEIILPESCVVGALTLDLDREIARANQLQSTESCTKGKTSVPLSLWIKLSTWACTSPGTTNMLTDIHQVI